MPSFDVVSEVNLQEVDNAVNQTTKEIGTRYDFRGSKCSIEFDREKAMLQIFADDKMKLQAMTEILNQKMAKRGVSVRSLNFKDPETATGDALRQTVEIKQGISTDDARDLVKRVKQLNLKKVQAQIQGEQVRVTGPKRDDLQEVIGFLKKEITNLDLQFTNFRD